eukprot:SAG11_NODE_48119_length_125_cov_48.346154_1_plen_23_part_01
MGRQLWRGNELSEAERHHLLRKR